VSEILTCEEAIAKYVRGGDTIAVGGFTVTRKPSDLGVMRFDKATKRMYLAEYYPGVSVEEIQRGPGFELDAGRAVEAEPPDSEVLEVLRRQVGPHRLYT